MSQAFSQVWPAFALVTGLLLVGVIAEEDGVFAAAGGALARLPGSGVVVYVASLVLVTLVTAVLNLDTSVFFLTPVLLHLARTRGLDEAPFLYGAVFLSNAASLFLPGSNLTNLIVLHGERTSGAEFVSRLWPAAVAAPLSTAIVLTLCFRGELGRAAGEPSGPAGLRRGVGIVAVAAATVLVLSLSSPALPVLAVGAGAALAARAGARRTVAAVDPRILLGLLALAVALGTLGRSWPAPADRLAASGRVGTAVLGAAASVLVNNLPASVLLAPHLPPHPRALLLGLNLGPNLAVTGSLSAFLWLRVARSLGARPSPLRYARLGLLVVPVSLTASLAALWLAAPGRL